MARGLLLPRCMTKTIGTLVLSLGLLACNTADEDITTNVDTTRDTTHAATTRTSDIRVQWRDDLRTRLDALDARLDELRTRGTAGARVQLFSLQERRDQLAADLDEAGDVTADRWDEFKSDVQGGLDQLEADVDAALE